MSRKALLVGINEYDDAPLRGCVPDVYLLAELLMQRGFLERDITLLTDRAATKSNIQEEGRKLTFRARVGDDRVMSFSAHGTQVPDSIVMDEADGLDEAICCYGFDWSPRTTLVDDEISQMFADVESGVRFVLISDSCHSGTVDRDLRGRPRTIPLPPSADSYVAKVRKKRKLTRKIGSRAAQLNIALISGCEAAQTSADAQFEGRYHGALTYHLVDAIRKAPSHASLRSAVAVAKRNIASAGFAQRPCLSGPAGVLDRPFLR